MLTSAAIAALAAAIVVPLVLHAKVAVRADPLRHEGDFRIIVEGVNAGMHAEFHREASRVLELALASRKQEARRLMASASTYTRTSAEPTRALQTR